MTRIAMNSKIGLVGLLGLMLLVPALGCKRNRAVAEDAHLRAAVSMANLELERKFREGDYEAVAQMYTDDAVILDSRGRRAEGREEINAYWIRDWGDANWRLDVIQVYGTEEMPVQIGRSQLTYEREDTGERVIAITRFAAIWRRQEDGSYRIAMDAYWRE